MENCCILEFSNEACSDGMITITMLADCADFACRLGIFVTVALKETAQVVVTDLIMTVMVISTVPIVMRREPVFQRL